eukprot:4281959-Pyramimonas_sp.AAC.1
MDVINSWALFLATSNVERKLIELTWARVVKDFFSQAAARLGSPCLGHLFRYCLSSFALLLGASRPLET